MSSETQSANTFSPNDDLEEGEIAEDSNDDGVSSDEDYDDPNAININNASDLKTAHFANAKPTTSVSSKTAILSRNNNVATDANDSANLNNNLDNSTESGHRPRKTRKVVRRVKKKIKVRKKVAKKKDDTTNSGGAATVNANHHPVSTLDPRLSSRRFDTNSLDPSSSSNISTHLMGNNIANTSNGNSANTLSNESIGISSISTPNDWNQSQKASPSQQLWQQQILMLQELQHEQILRAATTDEDLRLLLRPQPVAQNPNQGPLLPCMQQQLQMQQQLLLQQQSQSQTTPHQATDPNPETSTFLQQSSQQHQPLQQLLPQHQQQTNSLPAPAHHTPSSPDDESGKSSYEAISKMLTLLRNSANSPDPSDPNDTTNQENKTVSDGLDDSHQDGGESSSGSVQDSKGKPIEYSLIPILVEGIDYTKYKLLSQYEPKFKSDPRLSQQA